jgi:hypothetical protein
MIPETVTATPGEESSDALQLIDQMGEFFADLVSRAPKCLCFHSVPKPSRSLYTAP